jgi:hypothetical protein
VPRYTFPDDLLQAQRDWAIAYRQLARADRRFADTAVLRRRLNRLSAQIHAHPYWTTLPGTAPAARMELRQLARPGD